MTKKTFQAFADKISVLTDRNDAVTMAQLCLTIFGEANPRFREDLFVKACGLVFVRVGGKLVPST